MTVDIPIQVFTDVPGDLVHILQARLPRSITLLRRLQFTKFPSGKTEHTRIIVASDPPLTSKIVDWSSWQNGNETVPQPHHFTAAYLDPSRGHETNMWLYSTFEDFHGADCNIPPLSEEETTLCSRQIIAVLNEAKRQGRLYPHQPLANPKYILVASLHDAVKAAAARNGVQFESTQEPGYDKFIFKIDQLPEGEELELPQGLVWRKGTLGDCEIVKSKTNIPRSVKLLTTLKSMFIKLEDGTPVAWGFLGKSLLNALMAHSVAFIARCESFRRRGLARKVGAKLMREMTSAYGDDNYSSADVTPCNTSSQAMCKSLNGKVEWSSQW
ncbi:acetyltransferase [Colletotrichum truncatum]|uniref:Acetyltransferase n=1 Tax=Colletotrichum truncatum TaxID=5467 RepID=A0ACC3YBM6_COLTU